MKQSRFSIHEKLAIIFVMALVCGPIANGQAGTGTISGAVTDTTGAALANTKVTIKEKSSGQSRELTSQNNGAFVATALPIGEYTVQAEVAGFQIQVQSGIILQAGREERVDLVLKVGIRSDIMTVDASEAPLRTTSAEVGEVIAKERIASLPLNGRQFVDLTLLSDNVFKAPRGTRGSALAQTGTGVLVAGQRAGHNMYYLDGVSVTDQYFNHLVAAPPLDAIAEFNIQKSIYAPEFGGKASATISAIIKSGTNAVHGSAYEYFRNDVLDARNFFDPNKKPPYRQNQFGATIGGPIHEDRTFYFLSYEGLRVRQSQTQLFSVPTATVRRGDFTGLP
ncbi:MAG: carboxypeptidase-like regulatory domain-containing protein, partial [Acidobacteriota bacterium]